MGIGNFRDANGEAIQPYYAAFMIEKGYRTPAEAAALYRNQTEYMLWISHRWSEFEGAKGIRHEDRPFYREEFNMWIAERALDHQARNHVEAA
ncbi:hypothetical protein [Sinorhizobium sp. 22678]|uniref:hypothetical protein n=1 Tax=Sinorhizobium sp. 22678 TaxID=3453955 RepID=UPI003F864B87